MTDAGAARHLNTADDAEPWELLQQDIGAIDTASVTSVSAENVDQEPAVSASAAVEPAASNSEPTEMILVLGFRYQQGVQWGGRHVTIASFTPKDKTRPPQSNTLLADFNKDPKMKACLGKRSLPSYNLNNATTAQVPGYKSLA
jgi:hypothetical protein